MHTFLDERDRLEIDNRIKKASSKSIVVGKAGSVVNVTDGSNDPLKGLRVFGKTGQKTVPGNQLLNIDGNFIVNSDGTIQKNSSCYSATINVENVDDIYISGDFTLLNSGTVRIGLLNEEPTEQSIAVRVSATTSRSINISGYSYVLISFSVHGLDTTVEQIKNSFMANKGTTALPWEPYVGGIPSPNQEYPQELISAGRDGNVEVGVYGKNLLDCRGLSEKTNNGITYTPVYDTDGNLKYINANGTATATSYYIVLNYSDNIYSSDYILNGSKGGAYTSYRLNVSYYTSDKVLMKNGYVYDADIALDNTYPLMHIQIRIENGVTVSNLKFYPMIRLATIEDDTYEPYKPKQSLVIPTPNGLPGIKVTDDSLATYIDENGQMWRTDEVDLERGKYVQRVVKCTPNIYWNSVTHHQTDLTAENGFVSLRIPKSEIPEVSSVHASIYSDLMSNMFYEIGYWGLAKEHMSYVDGLMITTHYSNIGLSEWTNDSVKIRTAFRQSNMYNELYIYALLAAPIETPLSEEELTQYKKLAMNYPNTTILNDSNAHMEVKYTADIQNHIEQNYVSKEAAESLILRVSNIEKTYLIT